MPRARRANVLPGPALGPLAGAGLLGQPVKTILALLRAPEWLATAMAWRGDAVLFDIASVGETGLLPARRGPDGLPAPIVRGAIATLRGAQRTIAAIETMRSTAGTLALRGPMLPAQAFSPGGTPSGDVPIAPDGFVDTGYVGRLDPAAIIAALPDALLGQRLAGSAPDGASTAATLRARGANALLAGAFPSASRAVAAK
jgi:hypothetical protein